MMMLPNPVTIWACKAGHDEVTFAVQPCFVCGAQGTRSYPRSIGSAPAVYRAST